MRFRWLNHITVIKRCFLSDYYTCDTALNTSCHRWDSSAYPPQRLWIWEGQRVIIFYRQYIFFISRASVRHNLRTLLTKIWKNYDHFRPWRGLEVVNSTRVSAFFHSKLLKGRAGFGGYFFRKLSVVLLCVLPPYFHFVRTCLLHDPFCWWEKGTSHFLPVWASFTLKQRPP